MPPTSTGSAQPVLTTDRSAIALTAVISGSMAMLLKSERENEELSTYEIALG